MFSKLLYINYSLKVWNQDSFIPFTRLFASLLDYQDSISVPANVAITNHQAVQITRIWHSIFGGIDVVGKLVALLNCDSSFTSKRPELTSERWFQCMKSVIQILNSTKPQEVSGTKESSLSLNLHVCWTRPVGKCIEMVLEKKLSCALRVFLEPGSLQGNHKDCYDWESLRTLGDLIFWGPRFLIPLILYHPRKYFSQVGEFRGFYLVEEYELKRTTHQTFIVYKL